MSEKPAPNKRLQMADIARLAGVSTATVSRALSGSALINEQTRTRVVELARSLNYSIDVRAQSLRLGQNRTIAVVVPYDSKTRQDVSDAFFLGMIGSVADALTERGFDMLLSRVDAEHLDNAARLYETGKAIGVILIGQWHHHDQLNAMATRNMPIAVWGAQMPQQIYFTVGSDNILGGRMAAEHLFAQGRKKIVFLGDRGLPEVAHRYAGFEQAHKAAKLKVNQSLCIPAPFIAAHARQAVRQLCESGAEFDGVFACSDVMAMAAITALEQSGRAVPRDVSVVGYDDIEMARHFHPALTTIAQSLTAAGSALLDGLLQIIDGQKPDSVLLPTQLITRSSSVVK